MISRKHRFHGYGSLQHVYKQGSTIRGPLFAVKSLPNPKRTDYRLAVVVSRKVNKSAVVRNRIRRRLYEIVRQLEVDIFSPHDIVISVFSDTVAEQGTQILADQVKKQLSQAGVFSGPKTKTR